MLSKEQIQAFKDKRAASTYGLSHELYSSEIDELFDHIDELTQKHAACVAEAKAWRAADLISDMVGHLAGEYAKNQTADSWHDEHGTPAAQAIRQARAACDKINALDTEGA